MNFIHKLIGKKFLADALRRLKMLEKIHGYRTQAIAVFGMFTILMGYFFGPFEVAGLMVPEASLDTVAKTIWNGLMFVFLRQGVKILK